MDQHKLIEFGIAVIVVFAAILYMSVQWGRIDELKKERDRYRANANALFNEAQQYRVRDSLNAARAESLELTVKEYERFRADDAALIKELKSRNRDLASVNKSQSETIIALQSIPRDTTIIRDTIRIPAVAVHCGDAWYDFNGLLTAQEFTGTLVNRDSLVLAETVRYRRFLGFLWKTRKIQDRRVDVVSKNPHTTILGIEHVVIQK